MISFHAPHPSIMSTITATSGEDNFFDTRSDTSSVFGIADLFDTSTHTHHVSTPPPDPTPPSLSPPTTMADDNVEDNDPQPPPDAATPMTAGFSLIMQQRNAGLITEEQSQSALRALFSGAAPDNHSTAEQNKIARAKTTVRTVVPEFTGDQSATVTAGRWLETFETEATDAGLPMENWPLSAVRRFPTGSAASLWAASVFGGGLRFQSTWEDFRPAFVAQYTPANVVPAAQAAYEALSMASYGNDILAFNREFNVQAVHYDNVLRDAGRNGLVAEDLVTTYSIKLRGPVKLHLDAVLRLRASNNRERIIDGRRPVAFTIREAFAETESFARQQAGDTAYSVPAPLPTAPVASSSTGTVPMDLDTLAAEIMALRQEFGKRGRGGRRDGRKQATCYGCGGTGHFRRECPSKKEEPGKEET